MRIAAAILAALALGAHAQQRAAHAELDRAEIRIGEQAVLTVEATADAGPVLWPVLSDSLTQRIALVSMSATDTLTDRATLRRTLAITGYDTGYWAIPPLRFTIGAQAVETEALLLHVKGVALDPSGAPRPEKPLIELPFSPLWWARKHLVWIAGAAALAALLAAVLLLTRRRKAAAPQTAPAPEPDLHMRVLAELSELERQRLWQQGEHKAYQSRLTDVLRGYIEERFRVPALERTTDELLQELRVSTMSTDHQALVANMLRAADLVKFAKAIPAPTENEQLMVSAVQFVRDTAPKNPAPHATRP